MTFNNFISLGQDQQIRVLIQKGVRVSKREEKGCTYCLYQIGNFYVELVYDSESSELVKMRKFKCTNLLEPYLRNIRIKNILKKISLAPLLEFFEGLEPFFPLSCI